MSKGSPPPTRGTHIHGLRYLNKTKDHPRLRGEHLPLQVSQSPSRGSPPPTRGTQNIEIPLSCMCRITPAYAGNTQNRPVETDPL